jgi:hypothetical protein
MSLYLDSDALAGAVVRLGSSNARPSLCDFLVLKLAMAQGDGSVTLSLRDVTYMNSVTALAAINGASGKGLPPFFNPFGAAREKKRGWRTGKYPSNGPPDTVNGPGWKKIIDVLSERPRRVRFTGDYLEHLVKVVLTADGVRPRIQDAAVWFYRAHDLEAFLGPNSTVDELAESFLAEIGLTTEEQDALFRRG